MKTIVQLVEEQKEYFLEKDTAAKQAVEANIAPVETDPSSASRAYVVGEQLFLNDVLYDVTSPISVGDAIAVGTNITAANKLSADIKSKIDDLYSKNQTLTSAFVNNVNQSGSKNFANYDKTVTIGTSGSIGDTLFALDLEVGDKITFVCTQDNAMVSNTRNTLQVVNRANTSIKFLESNDANFHLASGLHILQFTVETAGIYNFSIWTHTLGTETTYSKFMVCDTDVYNVNPDYVPYSKTNRQLTNDSVTWDDLSEVGAVNFLNHTATNLVHNGITFTVNADRSITANGTATAEEWVRIAQNVAVSESVRASGCPKGGTPSTYFMTFSQGGNSYRDYGDGVIVPSGTIDNVYMVIKQNATVNNIVFKPMIAPVSYNGPYVPYAPTNKEIGDVIKVISDIETTVAGVHCIRQGNVVHLRINGSFNLTASHQNLIGTLPSEYIPTANEYAMLYTSDATPSFTQLIVGSDGKLKINGWQLSGTKTLFGAATYIIR